jgi:predicted TIM-barrel fold metal-dependent hydrolase
MAPVLEYLQRHNLPLTMHMGTTYARNAPVELGRAVHIEPVAMQYPDLVMVMAHMGHPWYEECIAVVRKQPNVYCEISALYYRPWQYYNILIAAQEYKITDKIFFGTDFPFSRVDESVDGLLSINDQLEGTKLPRVSQETMQSILDSDPLKVWWRDDAL